MWEYQYQQNIDKYFFVNIDIDKDIRGKAKTYSNYAILYSNYAILYSDYAILYSNYAIFLDVDFNNNFDIDWSSKRLQAIILGVN